jgi:predicted ribosomally synthesized peptide with SipW-like signal peptide
MDIMEYLVKLASIGTAGVSILAIFLIWRSIHLLPDSTPDWKVKLMHRYQNFCLVIAIICALSGGANAYFNASKAAEASQQVTELAKAYDEQQQKFENYQSEVSNALMKIQQDFQQDEASPTKPVATIENFQSKLNAMKFTPLDSIVTAKNQEKYGIKELKLRHDF